MMLRLNFLSASLLFAVATAEKICTSDTNTFTAIVDLLASELGYFTFKECPELINPTIGMEVGESYTFLQEDRSNWFHPLGFAYFPDGAHADKDELEPGISQTGSACVESNSCPTPRYLKDGLFLGVDGTDDFGLDVFEPEFFASPVDWTTAGTYSIELTFDDEAYTQDIFYFCHIHQFMSGRIKLLKGGVPISTADEPPLGYAYDEPGTFDTTCGTFGLDPFQLPNSVCPEHFVCVDDQTDQVMADYSSCIDAMNCHMLAGMTTGVKTSSPSALFVHQMIPHHQNAVNMAKTLLKVNDLVCDDLSNEDDPDCVLEVIIREIINVQNHQIQTMLGFLETKDYPVSDNCVVEIETVRMTQDTKTGDKSSTSGASMARAASSTLAMFGAAMVL